MSQSFHVVRCVNCNQFQNHIVKKSNKWTCKLCGSKQTLQQVFGTGASIDCRRLVQQLNLAQGEIETKVKESKIARFEQQFDEKCQNTEAKNTSKHTFEEEEEVEEYCQDSVPVATGYLRVVPKERSKWAKYEDESD